GGPTAPYGWNLVELTQQMYWYHSSLTAPHCAGSPWWAWPLDLKPVYWYFGASTNNFNGYIYDAGNPIIFWAALPAAALVGGLAYRARSVTLGFVALAMLTQFVAWIIEVAALALALAVAFAYEPARRLLVRVGVM